MLDRRASPSVLAVALLLTACGSSAPKAPPVPPAQLITGTVAPAGASLTVLVKDGTGQRVTGATDATGHFEVNVAGLSAPFLLQSGGRYSVALGAPTASTPVVANVHPLSDLMVRNFYTVAGLDPDAVFDATGAITPVPTADELSRKEQVLRAISRDLMTGCGVNALSFHLLDAPFNADGSGFDLFLSNMRVDYPEGRQMLTPRGGNHVALMDIDDTTDIANLTGGTPPPVGDVTPPSRPTLPTATFVNNSRRYNVLVTWTSATDDTGVAGYRVSMRQGASGAASDVGVNSGPFFLYKAASTSSVLCFSVVAFDASGNDSTPSDEACTVVASATPLDDTPPSAVSVSGAVLSDTKVSLGWTEATAGSTSLAGYAVLRDGVQIDLTDVGVLQLRDEGLNPSTQYVYTVASFDKVGNVTSSGALPLITMPAGQQNECLLGLAACELQATCVDEASGYSCDCGQGFTGDGRTDGTGCVAIDPNQCADHTDNCDVNATCTDQNPGWSCACNAGYEGDGVTCFPLARKWLNVDTSGSHACAVRWDHSLWCWGYGYYGELGSAVTYSTPTPVQLGSETTWAQVATGDDHTCAVKLDGTLWCWGLDSSSQLGDNNAQYSTSTPVQVGTTPSWSQVGAGTSHTCAIKTDGTLWCWGYTGYGQVGTGSTSGNVVTPAQVGTASDWTALSLRRQHTCAIRDTAGARTLWCWGENYYGEIGNGTTTLAALPVQVSGAYTDWATVKSGNYQTCGIRDDGAGSRRLWCWGRNDGGELGDRTTGDKWTPEQIGTATTWVDVALADYSTCGSQSDGTTWCWGDNTYGQLAASDASMRFAPSAIIGTPTNFGPLTGGGGTFCAIRPAEKSTLWCWGYNYQGVVGDGTSTNRPGPVEVNQPGTDVDECASNADTCDTNATCYNTIASYTCECKPGFSGNGQSGQCAPVPYTFTQVVSGNSHHCGLLPDHSMWCWGSNSYSVLGSNGGGDAWLPQRVGSSFDWASVAAGASATYGVKADGSLWAWGYNGYGGLGDGTTTSKSVPNLIGTDTTWVRVEGGDSHACALKQDGSLWCWGNNGNGQLGIGSNTSVPVPTQVGAATDWAALSAGTSYTCGIRSTGGLRRLWCWGYNGNGQLGNGTTQSSTIPVLVTTNTDWAVVKTGYYTTCGIRDDGAGHRTLWCWGLNDDGEVGDDTTQTRTAPVQIGAATDWVDVAVMQYSTCGSRANGSSYCWGDNGYGQLGTGTADRRIDPTPVIGSVGDFSTLTGRYYSICGLRQSDSYTYCWGYNYGGELGDGTNTNRPDPVKVSGVTQDVDECAQNADTCDANATCYNTVGPVDSYTCTCNPGYSGNGFTCTAVPFTLSGLTTSTTHSCGVNPTDHSLWCWGSGGSGELGNWSGADSWTPYHVGLRNDWSQVSAGDSYTCGVRQDGTLWCWGYSGYGQLGDGQSTSRYYPNLISRAAWSHVEPGNQHTCGIQADGSLWCWGYNNYGQLGTNDTTSHASPVQVGTATDWIGLSIGTAYSCGIRGTGGQGALYCWGYNGEGEIGNGTFTSTVSPPVQVGSATDWVLVKAGENHSCGIRLGGTLWCWGRNDYGQIGDNTSANRSAPEQITTASSWLDVSIMQYSTCASRSDGTSWCWGDNSYGQLGTGSGDRQIIPAQMIGPVTSFVGLTGDGSTACGLLSTGKAYCWGYNPYGQLGDGTNTSRPGPVQVGVPATEVNECTTTGANNCDPHATCYNTIGSYTCTCNPGYSGDGHTTGTGCTAVSWTWSALDMGDTATCGVLVDGSGWCWGSSSNGQLGNFQGGDQYLPYPVSRTNDWKTIANGYGHTCAVKTDGSLWCWGYGYSGQLGDGGFTSRNVPNLIGTDKTWSQVKAGNGFTCGIKTDGSLWCWGYNAQGQIGVGNTAAGPGVPTQVTTASNAATDWQSISLGYNDACAIRGAAGNRTLWCWGDNGYGQLGKGDTNGATTPTQVGTATDWAKVAASYRFTCGIRDDGAGSRTLWCWGYDYDGQLGNYTNADWWVPRQVAVGTDWVDVAVSDAAVCGSRADLSTWCWGDNAFGQLAGSVPDRQIGPTQIAAGNPSDYGLLTGRTSSFCGVRQDGKAWCWGQNSYGKLGDGYTFNRPGPVQVDVVGTNGASGDCAPSSCDPNASCYNLVSGHACRCNPGYTGSGASCTSSAWTWAAVDAGTSETCGLLTDHTLWCWGSDSSGVGGTWGQVGASAKPVQVRRESDWSTISVGDQHACAIKTDGSLWCWGYDYYGGLGDQTSANKQTPNLIYAPDLSVPKDWAMVRAGGSFSCGTRTDGSLWCWGYGGHGNLGLGDTNGRTTATQVGSATDWIDFAPGWSTHTCGIRGSGGKGTLWCWGLNDWGELGLGAGNITQFNTPQQVGTAVDWVMVRTGLQSTCGIEDDGATRTLSCWGMSNYGQGGFGVTDNNSHGAPTVVGTGYASIDVGYQFACGRKLDGTTWCWGYNGYGQIGNGTTTSPNATPIQVGSGTNWVLTTAGDQHACMLGTAQDLWCWGLGTSGQLGQGTTVNSSVPVVVVKP